MPAHYARHQLAGRGPRRRRQAPLSGRRVGAPPTPPPPGPPARCGAHVRATRNSRTQHRGTTRAGAGGFACAGGTWGYRVTARRTPAMATERLGRLHLSTLPRLGDVERVPRVPPLAPRGNGKATTYRAPLATPGVGAGLTAATISSAVRAFSRSAIRRARRSVSALILAVAPSSGRRRRPPCRRRSPCRRAPPLAAPTPRATSRHRRPGTPGQAPGRSSPCGTATRCSPACRQSRACAPAPRRYGRPPGPAAAADTSVCVDSFGVC